MVPSACLKGNTCGEWLQVFSQSVTGFLLFTIWAKANYIVHKNSTAEASIPGVHTRASYSQWWCSSVLPWNWSQSTSLFPVWYHCAMRQKWLIAARLCQIHHGKCEVEAWLLSRFLFSPLWTFFLSKLDAVERNLSDYNTYQFSPACFLCFCPWKSQNK